MRSENPDPLLSRTAPVKVRHCRAPFNFEILSRAEMGQNHHCHSAAAGVCRRGHRLMDGAASYWQSGYYLGADPRWSRVLAGDLSPAPQANAAICVRPRTDARVMDVVVWRQG